MAFAKNEHVQKKLDFPNKKVSIQNKKKDLRDLYKQAVLQKNNTKT